MIIQGKYTSAVVFAQEIEEAAQNFVQGLCDHPAMEGIRIAQMPDVHAGKGCNVGTAYPIGEHLNPEHIGMDIGCAVSMHRLSGRIAPEYFELLDHRIRQAVPTGIDLQAKKVIQDKELYKHLSRVYSRARSACPELIPEIGRIDERFVSQWLKRIKMQEGVFYKSLGTLGGGNHFIEYGEVEGHCEAWLTIHTGSRGLGGKVYGYWQGLAQQPRYSQYVGFLYGEALQAYLSDMVLAQAYAHYNHIAILTLIERILSKLCKIKVLDSIHSPHNYIDMEAEVPMLHKGSVDASEGSWVCIPFNMRDGIAVGVGRGNEEWNCSAPHGAGRRLSRTLAKRELNIDDFVQTMAGVYSSSVCAATIDEAPEAYKPTESILGQIAESIEVCSIAKPLFNIKDIPQ